ncbi:endonuclease domain-containing protein [Specibacter cremeus]|uniref:endonuclease domain-containing protein n=1 Tax=Specibacter cremeus TaxID=1629051 RepID=UPI000F797338|nr:hypothetical protein [Specibacter cremeus]
MFDPAKFPPELLAGPFTMQRAQELGVSYGKLRHARLVRLSRGIRMLDDGNVSLALLTMPYTQVTGYSAASHATAFEIWELPGFMPGTGTEDIHITRQAPHRAQRRRGVVGHMTQFRNDEVVRLGQLWITTRVRTWLDCSRRMSVTELAVAADHLLRIPRPEFEFRDQPYATRNQLDWMLDRHKGAPGIQKARIALELARVGSDSAQETRLRLALVSAGLPEPRLNVHVALAPGVTRVPDQSFPEYRVAVEYDGGNHADPDQVVRDIARAEDYAAAGWIEVRISKRHMADGARGAVRAVRNALRQRGWPGK